MFAGYVRSHSTSGNYVADLDSGVKATTATAISALSVAVKYGTLSFTEDTKLVADGNAATAATGAAVTNAGISASTFKIVSGTAINYETGYNGEIARTGSYRVVYYADINGKTTQIAKTFNIANEVVVPKVTVLSKNPETLDDNGVKAQLITNVDMNNAESNASITIPSATKKVTNNATYSSNGTRYTVRNVKVSDDYGQMTWNFIVPINATFRAE